MSPPRSPVTTLPPIDYISSFPACSFVEFAERIRPELKDAVLAVTGGFRSKGPMEEAIANGTCHGTCRDGPFQHISPLP